jgi:hypothetical protein
MFAFHPKDPYTPLPPATLNCRLKSIAKRADVTEVIVHAHAFRHTIVGKLMEVGNSAEVVSKFMGHASVDTTLKYYWLQNIEQLCSNMRNPFAPNYEEEKDEEEEDMKAQLAERRIDAALGIIHTYNETIKEFIDLHPEAKALQDQIMQKIPRLQTVLNTIADAVSSTTMGTTMSSGSGL